MIWNGHATLLLNVVGIEPLAMAKKFEVPKYFDQTYQPCLLPPWRPETRKFFSAAFRNFFCLYFHLVFFYRYFKTIMDAQNFTDYHSHNERVCWKGVVHWVQRTIYENSQKSDRTVGKCSLCYQAHAPPVIDHIIFFPHVRCECHQRKKNMVGMGSIKFLLHPLTNLMQQLSVVLWRYNAILLRSQLDLSDDVSVGTSQGKPLLSSIIPPLSSRFSLSLFLYLSFSLSLSLSLSQFAMSCWSVRAIDKNSFLVNHWSAEISSQEKNAHPCYEIILSFERTIVFPVFVNFHDYN